jgi:hypothetical protein
MAPYRLAEVLDADTQRGLRAADRLAGGTTLTDPSKSPVIRTNSAGSIAWVAAS